MTNESCEYNVWVRVSLTDGESPRIKGILCNGLNEPLLFNTQMETLRFWMDQKHKFKIDEKYQVSAVPKTVKGCPPNIILSEMINNRDLTPIIPEFGFIIENDPNHGPQFQRI